VLSLAVLFSLIKWRLVQPPRLPKAVVSITSGDRRQWRLLLRGFTSWSRDSLPQIAPTPTLLHAVSSVQHHHSDRKLLLFDYSYDLRTLTSKPNTMTDFGCHHTKAEATFLSLVASCDEYDYQPCFSTLKLH
jgi:hypothetical protein